MISSKKCSIDSHDDVVLANKRAKTKIETDQEPVLSSKKRRMDSHDDVVLSNKRTKAANTGDAVLQNSREDALGVGFFVHRHLAQQMRDELLREHELFAKMVNGPDLYGWDKQTWDRFIGEYNRRVSHCRSFAQFQPKPRPTPDLRERLFCGYSSWEDEFGT